MGLRTILRAGLLRHGQRMSRVADPERVREAIALLRPRPTGHRLIRVGGEGDGGYLVPDDLEGIGCCFSPGVSTTADFERALADDRGVRCFMADASVEGPPFDNPLFDFEKRFLGARDQGIFMRLQSWVDRNVLAGDDADLLLQMDIEGAEFDVLIDSSDELLQRFRLMVIEFHGMDLMFDRDALPLLSAVFAKLDRSFVVAHIHPNNCCGSADHAGISIPRVIEVTLLRRDRSIADAGEELVFPHPLDRTSVPERADIVLPELWWR